jgi:hypothetical protein
MTCTACVEFRNAREDGREKIHRSSQNHDCHCMAFFYWSPFVRCFIYNKPQVKFMHSFKTQYTAGKNYISSHAQNTTALHTNVFLTEVHVHLLLVTNKGASAFPSANNCQGQLKTPQSVSVVTPPPPIWWKQNQLTKCFVFAIKTRKRRHVICHIDPLYRLFVTDISFSVRTTLRGHVKEVLYIDPLYMFLDMSWFSL